MVPILQMSAEFDTPNNSTMYDEALSTILQTEGQITRFLHVIFGFLYRKTDFFHAGQESPEIRMQKIIRAFEKMTEAKQIQNPLPVIKIANVHEENVFHSPETGEIRPVPAIVFRQADEDTENGAVYDKYSWKQTPNDLDVKVFVSKNVTKSKQLNVNLNRAGIRIAVKDNQDALIEGKFQRPINSGESMWILVPGKYVQLTLTKDEEGMWESLLSDQEEKSPSSTPQIHEAHTLKSSGTSQRSSDLRPPQVVFSIENEKVSN